MDEEERPSESPPERRKARAPRGPAPLAACGVILVVLATVGLARSYEPEPAPERPSAPARPEPRVTELAEGRPIDVNRASAAELELLPRVGPRLAERIVEERDRNGPYRSLADLERVRGIGPRTVERLAPLATAGP
jgi:competence protein ComEA